MELRAARRDEGFTLIELMVVVVIATILLSLAVPSYMTYIRQSRRTEAKTALLDIAGREESYFATNGSQYTATAANLGFAVAWNAPFGSGYYQVLVCSPAAAACNGLAMPNTPAAPSYQVVAIPVAGTTQVNDTQCAAFGVDSTGQQYAVNSAGTANTQYCWAN
jgi:type IV pilus assembly protein PilE